MNGAIQTNRRQHLTRRRFVVALSSLGASAIGVTALSGWNAGTPDTNLSRPIRRLGYLTTANAAADPTQNTPSFSQALRELGYLEGRDVIIEARFSEGDRGRLPDLATELVRRPVDVIVTTGGVHSALAAKDATSDTPIVFTGFADPVGQGVVASLSRPGGNITGVTRWRIVAKLVDKILKGAAPADLPIEANSVFELVLNESMARKIGLIFPESVRRVATEIIQ